MKIRQSLASASAAMLAGVLVLSGTACAMQPLPRSDADLAIETSAARRYEVHRVQVRRAAGALSVSGDIEHVPPARILVPGKVEVSVVGADGAVLAQALTTPMRANPQARDAHFYVRLPVAPPAGSAVRIAHRLQ
jgi:hypothetical protein